MVITFSGIFVLSAVLTIIVFCVGLADLVWGAVIAPLHAVRGPREDSVPPSRKPTGTGWIGRTGNRPGSSVKGSTRERW